MKSIIIFGLCLLIVLFGCEKQKEQAYDSLDEAMKVQFNESIHTVNKCSINIFSEEEYLWFVFFGNCGHIKSTCEEEDICNWKVSIGASCSEQSRCRPEFTGRCVCRFREEQG